MCVGQPGKSAEGSSAPAGAAAEARSPVAEALAAGLVEVFIKGLSGYPQGRERAEECGRRRRALASKLWELQGAFQEVVTLARGGGQARKSVEPLLQRTLGCCEGLRQAAALLNAEEAAQLQGADAADAAVAWSNLEAALTAFEAQVQAFAKAAPGNPDQELWRGRGSGATCTCVAGLWQLCSKGKKKPSAAAEAVAPAPAAPAAPAAAPLVAAADPAPESASEEDRAADPWLAFATSLEVCTKGAPRVLCSDSYVAEALLVKKSSPGAAPAVTCIIEDPTQAQRLSAAAGALGADAVLLGSPRSTLQHLAQQGRAYDAVVLDEILLAELPAGLLAPGGRAVPRSALPAKLGVRRSPVAA